MVSGLHRKSELARWACYTLVISCIGSAEIIEAVAEMPYFEEAVGEIAFYAYWSNWPANFGSILQGILYGPHSVVQIEDSCDFI
ncbi:unnamed protein product [Orchesella dallaii]|uniref:Uncharacterized protein n=1 Tax=Orchesella dallaii TaxID=48710 RepID=A0ABP1RTV9_9HEXA